MKCIAPPDLSMAQCISFIAPYLLALFIAGIHHSFKRGKTYNHDGCCGIYRQSNGGFQ